MNGFASPAFDIFLVGSAYSGSTFLGGLLAANFDAVYVGETAHLPAFVERYGLYDEPLGCLLCAGESRPCPVWSEEIVGQAENAGPGGSMDVFRSAWGTPVVIDGSKAPSWLRLAVQDRPADAPPVIAIIVARSPMSYAVSASVATGAPTWEVVQWWRDTYIDGIRTVNRLQLPMLVLRNEELRQRPDAALDTIAGLVGQTRLQAPPTTRPSHSLGGNVWVQRGYSETTSRVCESFGWRLHNLFGHRQIHSQWGRADWTRAAQNGSSFTLLGPKTEAEALLVVQAVMDCPGLADVANSLGYQMGSEVAEFVGRVGLTAGQATDSCS